MTLHRHFVLIAAVDENMGMARQGKIPWHCPEDIEHFKYLTENETVIMGRKTWDSLPEKFRPLPKRNNIIISRQLNYAKGAIVKRNFEAALYEASKLKKRIFVIGGADIYKQALKSTKLTQALISVIPGNYKCDLFFPLDKKHILSAHKQERPTFTLYTL